MKPILTPANQIILKRFIDTAMKYNARFQKVRVRQSDDSAGLYFEIQTEIGLTEDEVTAIFGSFIDQCPTCGIGYNRRNRSTLEKALHRTN